MDSMRSLNRSLPSARSNRHMPPEELLPAFKQAALSVTNLYKSAASYHDSIRQAGYQDALDDLLQFLDKENLGLQDGEGWKVRQWVTARYDVSHLQQSDSEDDENVEQDQGLRSCSPEKTEEEAMRSVPLAEKSAQIQNQVVQQEHSEPQSQNVFHFSANSENTMQTDEQQLPALDTRSSPVRVEVVGRSNRLAHKSTRHNTRHNNRTTNQSAGSKRKLPFPDISEIFNLGFDKKDTSDGGNGSGGSKRTRFA